MSDINVSEVPAAPPAEVAEVDGFIAELKARLSTFKAKVLIAADGDESKIDLGKLAAVFVTSVKVNFHDVMFKITYSASLVAYFLARLAKWIGKLGVMVFEFFKNLFSKKEVEATEAK